MKQVTEETNVKTRLDDMYIRAKKVETNQIFDSLDVDEEWPRLEKLLVDAVEEKNETKLLNIIRRINDAFPQEITPTLKEEMKPLIKVIKNLMETLQECESKIKATKIINL